MLNAAIGAETEFLNIGQAASMLNVSAVSLRRWTDSGRLACVRVGAKRERRFRRRDLLAFLEEQGAATPAGKASASEGRVARVMLEGLAIDYGSHLCSLYDTDLGRVRLATPFLADGLRAGDVCFLVADGEGQEQILSHLGEAYDDLEGALERGQLILSDGMPTGSGMYDYLEQSFFMATRSGGQHLRLLGDMVWFLHQGMDVDELMDFERRYNHSMARRFPVVSLCQYDVRQFTGTAVLAALKCHEDTFRYPLSRFL